MLPAVLLCAAVASATQDSAHVVIVATTDVHGRATAWNYLTNTPHPGGLARAARAVDSLRLEYRDQVVLVDVGDMIQGEPFAEYFARVAPRDPNPIIDAMNLMAYDAATLGNHDFDFGLDVLGRAVEGAAFPYVSANVVLDAGPKFPPTTVVRRGRVRIGITGFTTPGVMVWNRRQLQGKARVRPILDTADDALAAARQDSDLSVVLMHSGMRGVSAYDTMGVGAEHVAASLASLPHKPDLVIVGHSHREMVDSVLNGVHFVQPRPYAEALAVVHVHLVRSGSGWRVVRIRGERINLARVDPDQRLERRLRNDHSAVLAWAATPLGVATESMSAALSRAQPTPILNFIHDAQRRRTGAQLSAAAALNLGAGFRAGDIRLTHIAALYPYENTLRAVRISGAQLKAFLEHSVRYFRVSRGRISINDSIPGYNYDMVAGAHYRIDLSRPTGDRIVDLSVDGVPVGPADSYTLALNSYRQAGGGRYTMLAGAPVVYDRGESVRDVLVDAVRARGTIDPARFSEQDWSIVPAAAAASVRTLFLRRNDPTTVERPVLRIVSFNDLDGVLLAADGRAVAARLEAALDASRAACDCATLAVAAGGQLSGTLVADMGHGRSVIDALNLFDLDAAMLGQRDLAWSRDTLERRTTEAMFPWVVTNVFDRVAGARLMWMRSSIVTEIADRRVAILGYLSPAMAARARSEDIGTLDVRPAIDGLRSVIERERERGADIVILLAQAGSACSVRGCDEELFELAHEVSGMVDLIIAGGDGVAIDTVIAGVPVVQALGQGRGLAVVDLLEFPNGTPWRIGVERLAEGGAVDSAVAAVVARHAEEMDSVVQRVVAQVRLPMPKRRRPSSLSRLVADAFRNAGRTDFALVPLDMLGAGLEAGRIRYSDLFQVLPMRRQLTVVEMTGDEFTEVVERAVSGTVPTMEVSGATVRYDLRRDPGKRVREVRLLDGRKIRGKDVYSVAVPDVMIHGPDAIARAASGRPSGLLDVDVLAQYLARLPQPVEAPRNVRLEQID